MVRTLPSSQSLTKRCLVGHTSCLLVDQDTSSVTLEQELNGSTIPKTFTFDNVYDQDSKQQDVYDECAFPLVESVLKGYNGTIFAYG
jgi:uncharacterized protein YabN with tetrapyrrole methylase and pyrophosphatase domain